MISSIHKKILIVFFALISSMNAVVGQQAYQPSPQRQREKLRTILQLQDRRVSNVHQWISLFTDPDPVIRSRTALAWGSLQDTTGLVHLIDLLWDEYPDAEINAVFAIGQTAGFVCDNNRKILEHDLIWTRLDKMKYEEVDGASPQDRCIEAIGFFGGDQALRDLIDRFGTTYPALHSEAMVMSIARFAIRGITDPLATKFLLHRLRDNDNPPWRVIYALQRVGDKKEIRDDLIYLAGLFKHRDPLFRMNLAALLGKLKDTLYSLDPLCKLAEYDTDWRVRVNAVKALGNLNLSARPEVTDLFRRLFSDENTNVAITSVNSAGAGNLLKDSTDASRQIFEQLSRMAVNRDNGYPWQLQGEAALALARLNGRNAIDFIHLENAENPFLREQLMTALGTTGNLSVASPLFTIAGGDDPFQARAALEGLDELCRRNSTKPELRDSIYECILRALASQDVALRTTAAGLLGDTLYARSSSVPRLLEALKSSHIPDDIELMQEIASTLGKLKDSRAIEPLRDLHREHDRSVGRAAGAALQAITGENSLEEEAGEFEPYYTDFDFRYLDSLPSGVRVKVETSRGEIIMELRKQAAPFTVMNFLKLAAERKFYNGKLFHRVVPNFVIQGGDPRGDGWGGPGYTIRSEFSADEYQTGSVGLASAGKDTEGSQFFITQSPQPHLDGRYTIIGKVVAGMDVVSKIRVDDHIYTIEVIH